MTSAPCLTFALLTGTLCLVASATAQAAEQEPLVRNIAISLDVLTSAGTSTARNNELRELKGGAHDPRRRGFTLQQAELTVAGDFDHNLHGTASVIASIDAEEGETIVELEEAMMTWRGPGHGIAVEAGLFFTDIGTLNSRHPHEREWLDQPMIQTRLLGGDGMRGPGLRLRWLEPETERWEFSLGGQNANGETMASFGANDEFYTERGIGGRAFTEANVRSGSDIVWSARAARHFEINAQTTAEVGASIAVGPNATGGDGDTVICGADFTVLLSRDNDGHRHAFARIEGEFLARQFDAAAQTDASIPASPVAVPATTLDDYGAWLQGTMEIADRWHAGLRAEWAGGSGPSYFPASQSFGRGSDAYRSDRVRISPLLSFAPSEAARIRLQYDYDDSAHLAGDEHSIWIGFEIQIGTHAPH